MLHVCGMRLIVSREPNLPNSSSSFGRGRATARTLRRSIEVVAADVIMPCSGSYSDGYCGFRAHLVSTSSENVKIKARAIGALLNRVYRCNRTALFPSDYCNKCLLSNSRAPSAYFPPHELHFLHSPCLNTNAPALFDFDASWRAGVAVLSRMTARGHYSQHVQAHSSILLGHTLHRIIICHWKWQNWKIMQLRNTIFPRLYGNYRARCIVGG